MKNILALMFVSLPLFGATVTNTLYYDDFSTGNNMSKWKSTAGSWGVENGVLRGSVPSKFSYAYYTNSYDNYSVEARVRFDTLGYCAGIGVRLNPANGANYSMCVYGSSVDGKITLEKYSDWETWTVLDTKYFASVGTEWHTLRVEATNSNIRTYLDGVLVANVTDSSLTSGCPFVTIYTHGNETYNFDVDTFNVFRLSPNNPQTPKTKVRLDWDFEPALTYKIFSTTNLMDWILKAQTVTNSITFNIDSPMMFFKVLTFTGSPTTGGRVTLAWDAVGGISQYKLYYGTFSRSYTNSVSVTNALQATVSNLSSGTTYFFAATAVGTNYLESDYSSEVSHTVGVGTNIVSHPVNNLRITAQ